MGSPTWCALQPLLNGRAVVVLFEAFWGMKWFENAFGFMLHHLNGPKGPAGSSDVAMLE